MISFTGSTAVGKHIAARGAETLKRVFLELGGKSANIVLDDANFAEVLPGAGMVCMHSGQGCAITTRLLLPRSRYDEGVEMVKAAFESFPYGDPTDFTNMAGPLINARQRERVLGLIETGKAEGSKCIVGGGAATQFDKGYFVQPTLFVDVDPDSTLAQQEIFGPVLVVIPYEDDDDAVRIANNSRYGLSGAVAGGSLDRALGGRPPDPHRNDLGQRRPVVRARLAVRWLQGERPGPRARRRRLRGVPRDEDRRPPREVATPASGRRRSFLRGTRRRRRLCARTRR